jgi:hypothetical protein
MSRWARFNSSIVDSSGTLDAVDARHNPQRIDEHAERQFLHWLHAALIV